MYLFNRVWGLLVSPSKSWDRISEDPEDEKKYLTHYFYPLIAMAALTAFLNPFIKGSEDLELKATFIVGLRAMIVSFVTSVLGFYLMARTLDYSFVRWFGMKTNKRKSEQLTAYASTPVLVIGILTGLLSDFFFMKLLLFYVIVLVWEASTHFYQVDETRQGRFTTLASVVILAFPFVVEKIFLFIFSGLK